MVTFRLLAKASGLGEENVRVEEIENALSIASAGLPPFTLPKSPLIAGSASFMLAAVPSTDKHVPCVDATCSSEIQG